MSAVRELERHARAAVAAAQRHATAQFVVAPVAAAIGDPLTCAALPIGDRFYLERPDEGSRLLALGRCAVLENCGPGRFDAIDSAARDLAARIHGAAPETPQLVGGFAFEAEPAASEVWEGFPAARLWLPEFTWHEANGARTLQATVPVEPGTAVEDVLRHCAEARAHWETTLREAEARGPRQASPARFELAGEAGGSAFRRRAALALRAIAAGELEKLVLARSARVATPGGFDVRHTLATLRDAHPGCAIFAVGRGEATFLGATPERLLRVSGSCAETSAVAGSAPRGLDPAEDAELARALRESKKEQSEHAVVVRALRAGLEACCDAVESPEAPRLLRLAGVQHLETPLRARLREGATLLRLAGHLHPTPAVGGTPREAALDWLAEHEQCDRGWYAGLVGYTDSRGGGELCVALRSALLRGDTAHLRAGAGLVAGSEPEAELRETRLKLRTLLDALVEL